MTEAVSIVIPVFDHSEQLERCLEALRVQTYPAERMEIVVVDNSPDGKLHMDGTPGARATVRWLHEPAAGSYAARNAGIAAAVGEVFAFTDADCIPAPRWVERGVEVLVAHPTAGIAAGRVDLFFRDPVAPTALELFQSLLAFEQREYVTRRGFGTTANLFARSTVVRSVGGFDARLLSRGDEEFGRRVLASGWDVVYCDEAVVGHPARRSLPELLHRTRRLAGGKYGLERLQATTPARRLLAFAKGLAGDFSPPLRFAARVFADPQVRGFGPKMQVVLLLALVRWVSAAERVRLALGAEPVR